MSEQTPPVLLIRINCIAEVVNTSKAVDAIRKSFPNCPVHTVSSPNSEALDLVKHDVRIDKINILSPTVTGKLKKALGILTQARAIHPVRATIVCYGATSGLRYDKHLLSSLLFRGKKYLIGPDLRLAKVASLQGLCVIAKTIGRTVANVAALQVMVRCYNRPIILPAANKPALLQPGDKVLVVRLDSLGDVVATLPIIQAISLHVGSPVDVLVREFAVPLLRQVPFIAKVQTYENIYLAGYTRATHRLIKDLRRSKYDVAIEMTSNSPTARLLCHFSASKIIAGFIAPNDVAGHSSTQYLDLKFPAAVGAGGYTIRARRAAQQLGIAENLEPFYFGRTPESIEQVNTLIRVHTIVSKFAVLHMHASTTFKSWCSESTSALIERLINFHDLDIILTGSGEDDAKNEAIRGSVSHPTRVHNLACKTPIEILPELYMRAQLIVTVDTGPAHIAAATQTPLVIIGFDRSAPFGHSDSVVEPDPARAESQPDNPLHSISVERVYDAIQLALIRKKATTL
jgi:heptosyltransferase-1